MASPLDTLAATINSAFKNIFYSTILKREIVLSTSPAYDPVDPPAAASVNYPCKALRDTYTKSDLTNSSILQGDVKLLILAKSLSVTPMVGDIILYQGASFGIINFDIDPANAVWVIQGRQ